MIRFLASLQFLLMFSFSMDKQAIKAAYFSSLETDDETVLQTQKYLAAEVAGNYNFSPEASLAYTIASSGY